MTTGLPVSRLINVQVNLTPQAAQFANFNSLLILGDSDVIDVGERIRSYNTLDSVASDLGTTAPEYLAASLFFGQIPQPTQLYVGRWAQTATHGLLKGGILSTSEQALSNFTSITNGAFKVVIDGAGSPLAVSSLNFSSATNLNGVASVIDAALTGADCSWNGQQFVIKSQSTGTSSTIGFATAPASGTDISALLKLTSGTAVASTAGIAAETALACVSLFDTLPTQFYGVMFASTHTVDADHLAVAAYIQGAGNKHVYGVTTTNANVLSAQVTSDIASSLKAGGYTRTVCQYSQNPYAIASFLGRAFTVDFAGNNTTITLMYKQEPGVVPETLTSTQADTLKAKRCNFFVNYNNNTAILQDGVMSGPAYFDEIHGTDWFANQIQTDVYNLLYTSPTKIPQTDAGVHLLVTAITAACEAARNNALVAPGQWNSQGFGQVKQGDFLPKGYEVYAPPIASQAQADREARKSPPIQVMAKLAGAIHTVDVLVNVNR